MDKSLLRSFSIGSVLFLIITFSILAVGKIDYNISLQLINRDSIWAQFFNLFGEQPAFWALLIGTVILLAAHKKTNKAWHVFCNVAGFLFTFLFSFMILFMPIHYIYEFKDDGIPNSIMIIVAVVALAASIILTKLASKYEEKLKAFKRHAAFLILLAVSEMILVNILKIIWGRPRMRSITSAEEFHYWYQIAGPADGEEFKSFPSGHTANAFMWIAFTIFIPAIKWIKPKLFITFTVLWGCLVALSRVILGAHFLSDVIAGLYVTLVLFFVYQNLLFKKRSS